MANRGFTIESGLKELKVDLNTPSFLGGKSTVNGCQSKRKPNYTVGEDLCRAGHSES